MLAAGVLIALLWSGASTVRAEAGYDVALEGVAEKELRSLLESVSKTFELKDRPPATIGLLKRRASEDVDRLLDALKSQGYYAAEVDFDVQEQREPVLVTFHVEPGPVFVLEAVNVELVDEGKIPHEKLPTPQELGLELKKPALARSILDAQDKLIEEMRGKGYAFAKIEERRVIADYSTREVQVTYRVAPGPPARFGPTTITGLQTVEEEFVRGKIPWKEGDRFNAGLLAELRKRLTDTRLFSLVRTLPAEKLEAGELLPITIDVTERKHRTVSAGVSYYTDTGPGVQTSWEHRNILGAGESLKIEAIVSEITYSGSAAFKKPAFRKENQSLLLSSRIADDDTDAYESRNTEFTVLVERELNRTMRIGAGPSFRFARVGEVNEEDDDEEDFDDRTNFALFSFPAYFNLDTSNDLMNPTRGGRLVTRVTPFTDVLSSTKFLKGYASYTHYWNVLDEPSMILANRAAVGSIVGADRDSIPADVRFYAGGGGSIRGYPYQKVGPINDDDPIGGASLLELSLEMRFKVVGNVGFVVFLDGGSAFESAYPDFDETLRWGAGAGIRYFTPIGPLRLDVGFPLNPISDVHDPFQIYVSLGQAF
jgi:translocation and assembly module TamA